jgi:hypothetical protein
VGVKVGGGAVEVSGGAVEVDGGVTVDPGAVGGGVTVDLGAVAEVSGVGTKGTGVGATQAQADTSTVRSAIAQTACFMGYHLLHKEVMIPHFSCSRRWPKHKLAGKRSKTT